MCNTVKVRVIGDGGFRGMIGVRVGFVVEGRPHSEVEGLIMIRGSDLNSKGANFKDPSYSYAFWVGREVEIVEEV